MDAVYYKILKELYPYSIGEFVNLSTMLQTVYPNVNPMEHDKVKHYSGIITRVITAMGKEGLIEHHGLSLGVGNTSGGYSWIDKMAIMAAITSKGKEALEKEESKGDAERLNQSIIEVNKSIEETNRFTQESIRFQTKMGKWTLRLTALSILFIGVSAYLQYQDKTDQQVEKLKLELQESKNSLKEIRLSLREINSSIQTNKTDTFLVKSFSAPASKPKKPN